MATRPVTGELDPKDVKSVLAGIVPPDSGDTEISAGFFHRTLARWLGLPEGKQPARKKTSAPLWDYDFWKAELHESSSSEDVVAGAREYIARLFRAPEGEPEIVRYWVKLDVTGRIRGSGWLSAPPVLVDDGPRAFAATPLDPKDLDALYRDP